MPLKGVQRLRHVFKTTLPCQGRQLNIERLPMSRVNVPFTENGETFAEQSWRKVVQSYAKSTQVFRCPSNPRSTIRATGDNLPVSYSASRLDATQSPSTGGVFMYDSSGPISIHLVKIGLPASTIMIVESTQRYTYYNVDDSGGQCDKPANMILPSVDEPGSRPGALFSGHLGTANFLFCDGHVKSLRPAQTVSALDGGTMPNQSSMWKPGNAELNNSNGKANLKAAADYYK